MLRLVAALLLLSGPALAQAGIGMPIDSRGGQVPSLTRSQAWPAAQTLPPQVLTDGATVAVPPGSGSYFLTLTGTGHTISCPAGALTNVRWMTFDLTQGAGGPAAGYQPIWDTCYGFPAFTPPILSRDTGAVDSVSCYSVPASFGPLRCSGLNTIGYGFLVRNNHAAGALCSTATCTVTLTNSVTGDFRVVGLFWGGGPTNPAAVDIVSVQDEHANNCTEATGAFGAIPAGTRATDIWYCQVFAGASSSTVTVTFAGTNIPAFSRVFAVEVAGAATSAADAGLGNHSNGTGTALSVASNGNMPQPSDFVFAFFKSEGGAGGTFTAGTNTTLLDQVADSGSPEASTYQIPTASGSVATNALTAGGSQPWSGSIAVFKHK